MGRHTSSVRNELERKGAEWGVSALGDLNSWCATLGPANWETRAVSFSVVLNPQSEAATFTSTTRTCRFLFGSFVGEKTLSSLEALLCISISTDYWDY